MASQRATLSVIDLSHNQMTAVPIAALATLGNLTSVKLQSNKIASIESRSFSSLNSSSGIKNIDLSYNAISRMDRDAFVGTAGGDGLQSTLKNLSLAYCLLTDQLLSAVQPLKALVNLNVENNQIANLDSLIGELVAELFVLWTSHSVDFMFHYLLSGYDCKILESRSCNYGIFHFRHNIAFGT